MTLTKRVEHLTSIFSYDIRRKEDQIRKIEQKIMQKRFV